jgi:hypothetical protein
MVIPGVDPFHNVLIDSIKEKPMKQPDVRPVIRVKAMIVFQICEEVLPFPGNTLIIPP